MRRRPSTTRNDIEVALGPHPARPAWRVLRVSFGPTHDHEARIAAALAAIVDPAGDRRTADDDGDGNTDLTQSRTEEEE